MNIGCKLQKLRKEKGLSQEELANILQVSRQSVSKWESDLAYPETDKLIKLCDLFNVTLDSLMRQDCIDQKQPTTILKHSFHYEYKSKRKLFGIPLVHINYGRGLYVAKGIIAIGNIAIGAISIGFLALGLISFGLLCLGLISSGLLSIGILLAIGSVAIGIVAIGAIAIGIFSIGALSMGYFSVGALSIGKYIAYGDHAIGMITIGDSVSNGSYMSFDRNSYNKLLVEEAIQDANIPSYWNIFVQWIKMFI